MCASGGRPSGAFAGKFDEARKAVLETTRVLEELGQPVSCGEHVRIDRGAHRDVGRGIVDAAENVLRATCEVFESRREWSHLATTAAELADALYAQERFDEADEWTRTAERHAASDDLGAQFAWRSVRAKVVAHGGFIDEANQLAQQATELVDRTDALNQRANVRLDRCRVLLLAGRPDEAATVAAEAAQLYEWKGNVVSAYRASAIARAASAGVTAAET